MRKTKVLVTTMALMVSMSITAFAGEWKQDTIGWWYENDDGSYPVNTWKEVDGKHYYFNESGYVLSDTITPDGHKVGINGARVETAYPVELSTTTSTPETVIGSGNYKIGTDIGAGEYVLFCNNKYGAYYEINSDSSGRLDSIIANDNFDYNAIITVSDGQYLKLSRCTLSPINEVTQINYTLGNMFKVGYHIPAGEYKLQCNSDYGAYYAVLTNPNGGIDGIISNDNFDGQAYITVKDNQYLQLSRCEIVK